MNHRHYIAAITGLALIILALVLPVPHAISQVEPAPRSWQYKVLQLGTNDQDILNQDGVGGWELVTISGGKAYLKKAL